MTAGEFADLFDHIGIAGADDEFIGAHAGGAFDLCLASTDGDDAGSAHLGKADEHQADGAEADDDDIVARLQAAFLGAFHHAGERLNERGVLVGDVIGDEVGVAFDDARGNAHA